MCFTIKLNEVDLLMLMYVIDHYITEKMLEGGEVDLTKMEYDLIDKIETVFTKAIGAKK